MQRRRIIVPLIVLAAVIAAALIVHALIASSQSRNTLRVSGNIEVTEVQMSFRIPGWVQRRAVDEGYTVHKGELIALLDKTELEQDVRQLEAARNMAKAALAELLAGSRPQEISASKATVERAKAEVTYWESEYERQAGLVRTGAITQSQFDSTRMSLNVAQAALAEAKEKDALVVIGPRQEDIDQAKHRLKQAEENLAIAQTRLSYATLDSPLDGVVLSKNVEEGEYVAAGTPIVTIGNLQDMWLRAYIPATELGKVKLGQQADVRTDSYPGKVYKGHITFIAQETEFTPKTVQTNKERVKLVYRIKITIDNPNNELKAAMPADADIHLDSAAALPASSPTSAT